MYFTIYPKIKYVLCSFSTTTTKKMNKKKETKTNKQIQNKYKYFYVHILCLNINVRKMENIYFVCVYKYSNICMLCMFISHIEDIRKEIDMSFSQNSCFSYT